MPIEYVTAGESHGSMLAGIISNVPAGLFVDEEFLYCELARRRSGYGRSARMDDESDAVNIISGVADGKTTGAPITLLIKNLVRDTPKDITAVRAGHADLAGAIKYGFDRADDVIERASARSTAMTVALGAVAKLYLRALGVEIVSRTVAIGGVSSHAYDGDPREMNKIADNNPVRCTDVLDGEKMMRAIFNAASRGDSLGGVSEITAIGCKSGIGSYVSNDKRLDGLIMREVGCVQSVKAVEIGDGFASSAMRGSEFCDSIYADECGKFARRTNRSGGIDGGMTNGENIVIRAYFKPVPTLAKEMETVDIRSRKNVKSIKLRADTCVVPAGGVVCEAAVALALARAASDSLGGDSMDEAIARYGAKRGVYD